jgi:quinol monooxygenase YgiN
MRSVCGLLLGSLICSPTLLAQVRADAPAGNAVFAVSYVEVMPASRAAVAALLKEYRDASRRERGVVGLELFEQVGRPGHFAVIETWNDQAAFDRHGAETQRLLERLRPTRVSDYDQRPYKALAVSQAPAVADNQAIHVITHVDTIPGPQSDGPGLLRRLAEASRQDPGNVRFDVLQHAMRANHFTVIETWQNQRALDAHAAAAHTTQYREALQPMSGSPLDERLYRTVD